LKNFTPEQLIGLRLVSRMSVCLEPTTHAVPYGTDPFSALSRHFVPDYRQFVPPGQKPSFFNSLLGKERVGAPTSLHKFSESFD
jgi:hypothetical protein